PRGGDARGDADLDHSRGAQLRGRDDGSERVMMERERRRLVRVGFFVWLGRVLFMPFIIVFAGDQGLFSRQVKYSSSFHSIDGLKPGSPVRLAGVQVGTVTSIRFFDDPADPRVRVEMNVLARYADRIREDSTASIGSLGVLGDKVMDLDRTSVV